MTSQPRGHDDHEPIAPPIRVTIQQPALPLYRVPVYRTLAQRPGLRVRVINGQGSGTPPSVAGEGFETCIVPMRTFTALGQSLLWHGVQLSEATPARSDVLILSWNIRYLSLLPALLKARRQGVGTVLWGHGYSKTEAGWRAWPRRKVAELADALLFYNHTVARRFVAAGWPKDRVFVALNALDQQPIQQAREHWLHRPEELRQFQAQRRLDPAQTILYISRFDPANRLEWLLEAAARLTDRYPRLALVVIGKGDEAYTRTLREQVHRLGLTERVQFVGAVYDELELAPWFLSATVFCYPANIGLSLLHAFGYGLPVVTSDHLDAQNPEIEALEDGENGLLYRHGEPEHLAAQLDRLLSDASARQRMGERAHRTAVARFTVGNMVDGMEQAVRHAAAARVRHKRSAARSS